MTKNSSNNKPRRARGARLGQHFLTRSETAAWVADAAALTEADTVLEIGPGHGILTRELLKRAGRVVAVEKDRALVAELHHTFKEAINAGRLTVLHEDVRDFVPESLPQTPLKLVANIPYYLTGYILRKFLTTEAQPISITVLIQKEVAERIVAQDGAESLLSLSVKVYGGPSYVKTVKAGAFSPPPSVDSAILHIADVSRKAFVSPLEEERFFTLLTHAFREKRKRIAHTLKHEVRPEMFVSCGIDSDRRPQTLGVQDWLCLCRAH